MSGIIYVIHPALPRAAGDALGYDKVLTEDIEVDEETTKFDLLRKLESWWGGRWPETPKGYYRWRERALDFYRYYETERSRFLSPARREYVVHHWLFSFEDIQSFLPDKMVK